MARSEQKRETRQRILDAAGRGFRKGGFGGSGSTGSPRKPASPPALSTCTSIPRPPPFVKPWRNGVADLKHGVRQFHSNATRSPGGASSCASISVQAQVRPRRKLRAAKSCAGSRARRRGCAPGVRIRAARSGADHRVWTRVAGCATGRGGGAGCVIDVVGGGHAGTRGKRRQDGGSDRQRRGAQPGASGRWREEEKNHGSLMLRRSTPRDAPARGIPRSASRSAGSRCAETRTPASRPCTTRSAPRRPTG